MTAPIPPQTAPSMSDRFVDAPRQAPQKAPEIMRASKGATLVRRGIEGARSATSSPSAAIASATRARFDSMNANGDPYRFNQASRTADAIAAGARKVRKPATTPMPTAKKNVSTQNPSGSVNLIPVVRNDVVPFLG